MKQKEAAKQTGNRKRLANSHETEIGWRTDRKQKEAGEQTGNRLTDSKSAGGKYTVIVYGRLQAVGR